MNQITCILDACSIINLIHIDEDDFLIKKLKYVDFFLCEEVFKEVSLNVYNKFKKGEAINTRSPDEFKERKKEIDNVLNNFRNNQKLNNQIEHDLGRDIFDQVKELTGYKKNNGEFYSTVLSLYISRCKPSVSHSGDFHQIKVFFHTDDSPAKDEFRSFFLEQQIGYIEDTSDLLMLLYRLDDNFTENQLKSTLSKLFSEYATEVSQLEKRLRELKTSLPTNLQRDKLLISTLNKLINKLHQLDFKGINEYRESLLQQKKKYRIVNELFFKYNSVFELESNSSDMLAKIKKYQSKVETVYRV